jgi:site-specific recombinase XerD
VDHQRCTRRAPTCRRSSRRSPALPHQLRHAHAVEMAREGVPLIVIQRQLGHSNLGITSVYLQGIDNAEIIETVRARRAPMIPVIAWPRS